MAGGNALWELLIDRFAEALAQNLDGVRRAGEARPQASLPGIRRKRKKGAKRSPVLIAKTTAALLAHINAKRGQRIEQIAVAMKIPTNDLKLPAQKLLADKKVKTKGQKRGTQYFPGLRVARRALLGGLGRAVTLPGSLGRPWMATRAKLRWAQISID